MKNLITLFLGLLWILPLAGNDQTRESDLCCKTTATYFEKKSTPAGQASLILLQSAWTEEPAIAAEKGEALHSIDLSSRDSSDLHNLKNLPIASEATLKRIRATIAGKWENIHYPFDLITAEVESNVHQQMEGAFLQFDFKADGSFVKTLGNSQTRIEEIGRWEVSRNGKYLLLYGFKNPGIEMAKIKHLEMDELVVEYALKSGNTTFCTALKNFYFNKQ